MLLILIGSLALLAGDFSGDWRKLRSATPEGYLCARGTNIVVDGRLDEPTWAAAPWTREFQDIEGPAKPRPRFKTRAKMLWDDDYFYVAAELEEPHIWGTITNHDAVIFQDPDFEVFIDPDGDRQNYYEFEMNALNTGWDLILKKAYIDGGPALNEWEIPGLKTAVRLRGSLNDPSNKDEAWTVEIALPWKVLREFSKQKAPPEEGDTWHVDFSRVEWQIEVVGGKYRKIAGTKEDNWVWSPTGLIDMHRPENWGLVRFVSSAQGKSFVARRDDRNDALLDVYYAQKSFHEKNGRWAASLGELELKEDRARPIVLVKSKDGYEARLEGKRIRQDGLLW